MIHQVVAGLTQANSTSLDRIYEPADKHKPGGHGTPIDLPDGTINGNQIWGIYDNQVYLFQNNNLGTWHGYNVTGLEKPPKLVMQGWKTK